MHLPALTTCLAVACAAALSPAATAQRLLVPHGSPQGMIALVDASAGALIDPDWIDVVGTAMPTPSSNSVLVAERVADEVWVAAAQWVHRYDARTRAYVGSFAETSVVRSLEAQFPASGAPRVLVTCADGIAVRTLAGQPSGSLPIFGAADTLDRGDGTMLVANRDASRIDRHALDGTWLGVFAGPSIPSTLGVLSRPQQIVRRIRSDNILVCGDVRAYEFDSAGQFLREIDVGPFERGIADTIDGRLFVTLASGFALHDPEAGTTVLAGGPFFGQGRKVGVFDRGLANELVVGDPSARVLCRGTEHPGGTMARLVALGSSDLADTFVTLYAERLPLGSPVVLALSRDAGDLPVNGGTLCVARDAFVRLPQVIQADASGIAAFTVLRGPIEAVPLSAGLTLHAQALFSSEGELHLSSGLRVSLGR